MATDLSLMTTDWFNTNYSTIDFSTARAVKMKLYVRGPAFNTDYLSVFSAFTGISDLTNHPEWVEIPYTLTPKLTSSGSSVTLYLKKYTSSGSDYVQVVDSSDNPVSIEDGAGWYFTDNPSQTFVYAAVFYLDGTYSSVVNPIVAATTHGIGNYTVVQSGSIYGQFKTGITSGNQYIFARNTTTGVYSVGYTLLKMADPVWESAHTHHLWVQPQRVNFVANPSFERTGGVYWRVGRASGTATLSSTGTSGSPAGVDSSLGHTFVSSRYRCGNVQASTGSGNLILESNLFPKVNTWYSVSFYVSGSTGDLYYGLVVTDPAYTSFSYIRNANPLSLSGGSSTSGFQKVTALVQVPEDIQEIMFRLEFTGTQFWVDDVLVDPHEGQYEYFDGNSNDGLPGDFRWMGGSSYSDKHFSIWYNNYVNTRSRLIGDYDTTDDIYKPGLVEEWAPTGASIIAHWDAVTSVTPVNWSGDAFYAISDVKNTPVSVPNKVFDFSLQPL